MNMQTLYDQMKDALIFFGVSFSDMGEIDVSAHKGHLVFRYEDRVVATKIPKTPDAEAPVR